MSLAIERRYRRVLRWYPRDWREQNGEVLISTLLDVADGEGRDAPGRGELVSLASAGLAARVGAFLPWYVRDAVSTVALGGGAVLAAVFLMVSWLPWSDPRGVLATGFVTFGPFVNPGVLVYPLWAVAIACGLLGKVRALRVVMLAACIAPLLLLLAIRVLDQSWLGPSATTLIFFSVYALLVLIGNPRRPIEIAGTATVTLVGALLVQVINRMPMDLLFDWSVWSGMAATYGVALAAVVAVVAGIGFGIARKPMAALLVFGSGMSWVLIWIIGALHRDLWNTLGMLGLVATGVGFAIACRVAIRRSRISLLKSPAARTSPDI